MSQEGQLFDQKSLRAITGKNPDWSELAKDCVAFANAQGGIIRIGVENQDALPPPHQAIDARLPDILRKRITELTLNVNVVAEIKKADNGGQYIDLQVARSVSVASTSDGKYFIRIADQSKPVLSDEILRLMNDRASFSWETLTSLRVPCEQIDLGKLNSLVKHIRASDRVKAFVKEKSDNELLNHYQLANGDWLTNLGILCIGQQADRARLGTAPAIHFIKYDELENKMNKIGWDDHALNPMELVDAVWNEVPDWEEFYEIPDGLYRQQVPLYDEKVVRELLINALVHRPYTQRGDIYLNLYPDRLQMVNPGLLPLGVTVRNILHTSVRRNEHLARIFHDLKLMEREGSGYDRIYEVLLTQGKPLPKVSEGDDRVTVTVQKKIINDRVIDFIAKADQTFALNQKEKICLGLLAQHESMTARELVKCLELNETEELQPWLHRLLEWNLIHKAGRTQATKYFIDPTLLRKLDFKALTTLKRIQPHRLQELILEDLRRYPDSGIGDVHQRVGIEIHRNQIKRTLDALVIANQVHARGEKKGRRYRLAGA